MVRRRVEISGRPTQKSPSMNTSKRPTRRRAQRARPVPRWLTGNADLDAVAQRRCLMLLSVLSGERPVTSVVEELGLSRGTYYQLETRALVAMLRALAPGAETNPEGATQAGRIAELEERVAQLEQDKRRLERLLYLTRKVVPAGPVTTGAGRPRGRRSTTGGPRPSTASTRTTARPSQSGPLPSIPTTDGATTR